MDFVFLSFLIFFSFFPSVFWLFFYYNYSPRFTTSKSLLFALFFLGIGVGIVALFVNQAILQILPEGFLAVFEKAITGESFSSPLEIIFLFFLLFFIVAPVEEGLKFFALYLGWRKSPNEINQIIDGLKFGIMVGLGFAVLENGVYFFYPLLDTGFSLFFLKIFCIRFFLSTVSHSLYTAIMGYYFSLSRFYRLYSKVLIRKGIILAILFHAIFDFFLLVKFRWFLIVILLLLLWLMIKWCWDRANLETFISAREYQRIYRPIFSEKKEFEGFLFKHKIRYEIIKKLNLCPFCFRKRIPGKKKCPYCNNFYPAT